jgi:hypothetical protein
MAIFTKPEPLTDTELDRLGDFLESCKGGKAMNLEEPRLARANQKWCDR